MLRRAKFIILAILALKERKPLAAVKLDDDDCLSSSKWIDGVTKSNNRDRSLKDIEMYVDDIFTHRNDDIHK